jgi:hypothetical protein
MNRRSFLTASSATLVVAPSFGQDQPTTRTNGNWWNDLNALAKYGYIVGYADGSSKADATWASGLCKTQVPAKYMAAVQNGNDYSEFTIGQLVEGVNQFYKDFRNTKILTRDAMMVVRQQISGVPQKEIDEGLEFLRQLALNPQY